MPATRDSVGSDGVSQMIVSSLSWPSACTESGGWGERCVASGMDHVWDGRGGFGLDNDASLILRLRLQCPELPTAQLRTEQL